MKYFILILLIALMLFIPACSFFKKPIVSKDEATVIVAAGNSIKDSADNIDNIVEGSVYEEPVKVETDNIREEVKKLSYEEIDALYQPKFKKLTDEIKIKDKKISDLTKLVEKLKDRIKELENFARAQQVKFFNWLGGILTFAAAGLLYFRQKELAGYALLGAAGSLGLAQILGSIWFFWICVAIILIIAGGASYALYKQLVSNETEEIVMNVLEETYNMGTPEEKAYLDSKIFEKLSKKMSDRHKKYVTEKKI